jgi:chromate transporter
MSIVLIRLLLLFGGLSMLAFGGGSGVLPDMQRASVDQYHWLTNKEFLDMFAISRAQPGPGSLIVVLIGLKAAGLTGAMLSFIAMFTPPSIVVFAIARFWHRAAATAWRQVVERALAPVAVGLTFASGLALMRQTEHGLVPWGVSIVSAALFSFTGINPLLLLAGGAAVLLLAGT